MSRWKRISEEEWEPGLWKFYFRDDSYVPGDAIWLFTDENVRNDCVTVTCRYDTYNSNWVPPELIPDAIDLLQRYYSHHYSALEQLAQQAE